MGWACMQLGEGSHLAGDVVVLKPLRALGRVEPERLREELAVARGARHRAVVGVAMGADIVVTPMASVRCIGHRLTALRRPDTSPSAPLPSN